MSGKYYYLFFRHFQYIFIYMTLYLSDYNEFNLYSKNKYIYFLKTYFFKVLNNLTNSHSSALLKYDSMFCVTSHNPIN